jgi:hypothetical protein
MNEVLGPIHIFSRDINFHFHIAHGSFLKDVIDVGKAQLSCHGRHLFIGCFLS